MPHKRPPVRILVPLALLLAAGAYYGIRALSAGDAVPLRASGTIEAVTINIAAEMAGRIVEVSAEEGESVNKGEPVLRIDDSLLSAQRDVAAAALLAAQASEKSAQGALAAATAQYQIALETALLSDRKDRLSDWFAEDPDQFEQPGWYFSRAEQIEAAQSQVDAAWSELEASRSSLMAADEASDQAAFLEAERRLLEARLAYLVADAVNDKAQNSTSSNVPVGRYNRTHCGTNQGYKLAEGRLTNVIYTCEGDPQLSEAGEALYQSATAELADAQAAYNTLLSTDVGEKVLSARAAVAVAQERYYSTLDLLYRLQTADQAPAVTAARLSMEQAGAAVEQARAAVSQARASVELLERQIAKLTVYAPTDGVILTRAVEPGEFVQPGAAALTMADLGALTITVYVPEDRYGAIRIGQRAAVTVDSFPDRTFAAEVTRIADEAEYTPRNVQTVEGRSSTVYAVTLKLLDAAAGLKIGMPADVDFLE